MLILLIYKTVTEDKNVWTSKQTYLAMGNLWMAELKIDVSPMEGFVPEKSMNC
jgi:hypothetical protein